MFVLRLHFKQDLVLTYIYFKTKATKTHTT